MSADRLRAENAQLRQALQTAQQTAMQQQMILHQRAEPQLTAVMDALDTLAQMAEQGHPQARELLARWNQVQRRVQGAGSKLTVVRNGGVAP